MSRSSRKYKSTRKQSPVVSAMLAVAVVVVCFAVAVRIYNLKDKSAELKESEKALTVQINEANNEREELEAKEQYMKTTKYIEDVAKDRFGLVYPDEIVIRPSNE